MRYLFALIVVLCLASTLNAQVSFGISFNLNSQPAWGPTGYDYAGYYYLPDIEVYYNVPLHRFYYNERGRWRYSSSMLPFERGYNLYNSYKVVVNEPTPYRNHKMYKGKYSSYKGRHDQQPIRDSKDSKYFVNKYHPEHNNWVQQQRQDNSRNKANKQNNNRGKQDKGKGKK